MQLVDLSVKHGGRYTFSTDSVRSNQHSLKLDTILYELRHFFPGQYHFKIQTTKDSMQSNARCWCFGLIFYFFGDNKMKRSYNAVAIIFISFLKR